MNQRQIKNLEFRNPGPALNHFNPEKSQRQERKNLWVTKQSQRGRKSFYDEAGCMISTGKDLCDCLMRDCSGCFYPCENCRSLKCGKECRVNRRWHYSNTEVEGGPTRTFPQLPLPSKPNGLWTYCSAIAKCARCVAATLSELLGSCNTRLVQQQ